MIGCSRSTNHRNQVKFEDLPGGGNAIVNIGERVLCQRYDVRPGDALHDSHGLPRARAFDWFGRSCRAGRRRGVVRHDAPKALAAVMIQFG
jgi:hypothetical protein